jgi:hypothetical protein
MKLSEEIDVMRRKDMDQSAKLSNSKKQIHEMKELETSLKRELDLCKSRYGVLTMQADKRQKELLKQMDKQKVLSNDRLEVLVERISSLERLNRRLMTKAQAAVLYRSKMEEAEQQITLLNKKLSTQTVTVDHLMATNDELTSQKRDLEERLQRALKENEEYSPDNVMAEVAICSARTAFLEKQLEDCKEKLKTAREETLAEKDKRQSCQRTLVVALRRHKGLEDSSDKRVLSEPAVMMSSELSDEKQLGKDYQNYSREKLNDSDSSNDEMLMEKILELDSVLESRVPEKDRTELIARLKEKAMRFEKLQKGDIAQQTAKATNNRDVDEQDSYPADEREDE